MKIALISANREMMPEPVSPLGLLYILAAVEKDHCTKLFDLCFLTSPIKELSEQLEGFKPDVIAIGFRNIQNRDYTDIESNLIFYKNLIDSLRQSFNIPIVIGGSGFSVLPRKMMNYLQPDFGISGEGEAKFQELIRCLDESDDKYREIPNLYYFDGDELIFNTGNSFNLNLNTFIPIKDKLASDYYNFTGTDSIQTKRGCPFECTYCTYPLIEGSTYRLRDPENVVNEMLQVRDSNENVDHFFIVDSVFNHPINHAKSICREMIKRKVQIEWSCYINPKGFDEELARLMKESNCRGIEIGTDSGNDQVLKSLKKGFLTKDVKRTHEICKKYEIKDCHTFVLGTEGESIADVEKTLDFIEDLNPFAAILMIWTEYNDALELDQSPQRDALNNDIIELLKIRHQNNPSWIIPALEVNFNERLFNFLRKRKVRGPLWEDMGNQ